MSRKLLVSDGTRERELQLVGRIVVGRDPTCDITHDHSLLSRRHAEFVSAGDLVVVRDLGSRNGVFVNGAKTAEHSLHPGDVVQIGPLRAQYVVDKSPLSIAPEDHDTDRTAVRRDPAAKPAAVPPVEPSLDLARDVRARVESPPPPVEDDDEATRLITAKPPVAAPAASLDLSRGGRERVDPPAPMVLGDDDETRFVPHKVSLEAESTDEAIAQAVERRPAGERIVAAAPSLRGFLFAQLLVFAGLIIVTFVVALLGAGVSAPLPALLVTAVVAAVAAFVIAGLTDRRVARAASAQDVP